MKEIYIVLIRAHTGLGSIARRFTGYEYTHIAVSLERSLTDFVSYSRRYHNFPFDAGFTHECRDYYAFGKHQDVKIKVFRLCPDNTHYNAVLGFIEQCENDNDEVFNLFSMATMPLLHGFRIYKANNCMSFTAKVIELSGAADMPVAYYKYSIKDIDELLEKNFLFEGRLRRKPSERYNKYMRSFEPIKYFSDMSKLLLTLVLRLIYKK